MRHVNRKILIVDDEPVALRLYSRMLRSAYDVVTAVSGAEGLAFLRNQGPFPVVISDMRMTRMNGVQFLKGVRELSPNTVRLLLTGNIDFQGAVDAVNEGYVFRLLLKPCGRDALLEAINAAFDCYDKRREERVQIELPLRVHRSVRGLEQQSGHTADISTSGARLAGLQDMLEQGEVVEVECSGRKASYRVVWTGVHGTSSEGQAGLECLEAGADIWKLNISQMEDGEALERARVVQHGLLPQEKPLLTTLDYAGHCIAARTIGGDYYDFLDMGPGEIGFVLADVSGKGIPAALLMASLQGSLHSLCGASRKSLPELLASLNLHFYKHTSRARYATFFFGHYSDATRTLCYANCGHNPPILLRDGGEVERLEATATVLGLFSDWECSTASVQLEKGDVLGIYTDGISETRGNAGEEFGEARILESLRSNRDLEAEDIVRKIENAVEQFKLGEQKDDLTLVIARAR